MIETLMRFLSESPQWWQMILFVLLYDCFNSVLRY